MRLKDVLSEAIKIQGKPDHWPGDDHIILVTTAPTKTYALKFNNKNDSYPNSIRFPNNMGTKPVDTNKAAREFWLKIKADVVKWRSTNESINEGRGIKSIQNDLNKTIAALESEISDYKSTKGTPQEKKHIDNLKKLHPIKKKLEAELEMAVSGLYRDAELKIED